MKKITLFAWMVVSVLQAKATIANLTEKSMKALPVHPGDMTVRLEMTEGNMFVCSEDKKTGKLALVDPIQGSISLKGEPAVYEVALTVKKGATRMELTPTGTLVLVRLDKDKPGKFNFYKLIVSIQNGNVVLATYQTIEDKAYISDQENVIVPTFGEKETALTTLVAELMKKCELVKHLDHVDDYEADIAINGLMEGSGLITDVDHKNETANITGRSNNKHVTGTVKWDELQSRGKMLASISPGMAVKIAAKGTKLETAVLEAEPTS